MRRHYYATLRLYAMIFITDAIREYRMKHARCNTMVTVGLFRFFRFLHAAIRHTRRRRAAVSLIDYFARLARAPYAAAGFIFVMLTLSGVDEGVIIGACYEAPC